MDNPIKPGDRIDGEPAAIRQAMYPLIFSAGRRSSAANLFFRDIALQRLAEFFESKGLGALKDEDQRQQWYGDWIVFQKTWGIYASLLSPSRYSTHGNQFDLSRLTRFLEVFGYFSPAHGYSLQVTFLGLFSILLGENDALKREAVAALEKGALFALGVSEKEHGSDLLASEFTVAPSDSGNLIANGTKYYIGNANCATIISILARKADGRPADRARRAAPILFALRPQTSKGYGHVRKISTLGIRSAFVGEFQVKDHQLPETDLIAQGRAAWEAVLGTVTLGKFFLGFGSIGICERAFEEAVMHLSRRVLYGKPVIDMPHIGLVISQAYARLTAMKLYAYRALDYVQTATESDRRYLLYCAVQKARVSTEGVKVVAQFSECIGAKGFESDTYFEMALRDIQLIPSLEGSMHINMGLTAQFIPAYFNEPDRKLRAPDFSAGWNTSRENTYLMEARTGQINTIKFKPCMDAFKLLKAVRNVLILVRQIRAFRMLIQSQSGKRQANAQIAIAMGHTMATIAYAQLVAENAAHFELPAQMVSAIFHLLVNDLSSSALALASSCDLNERERAIAERMIALPTSAETDWDFVLQRVKESIATN